MAIIDYSEEQPEVPTPEPVLVAPTSEQRIAYDTRSTPLDSIITHVEGSPWIVDGYYSQTLTKQSELSSLQPNQAAVYQQYTKIVKMELRVNSPLQPSQNNETRAITLVGQATVYNFLIPNKGDMFIAGIGDGRTGLFTLTNTEKKSILKGTTYSIEYQLVDYLTPEYQHDLDAKTIKTVHFVKERIGQGQRPVLVESELRRYEQLKETRRKLISSYTREFYSRQFKVLLVPGQDEPTYDPYLTDFIAKVIGGDESAQVKDIKSYNLAGDDAEVVTTLWDALLVGEVETLHHVNAKMWTISTSAFRMWPTLQSVYYSELQRVVYPIDQQHLVDHKWRKTNRWVGESIRNTMAQLGLDEKCRTLRTTYGLTLTDQPLFHPVSTDDYYVFSQAFYDRTEDALSILEAHTLSYLKGKVGDVSELLWMCACSTHWTALERYYYTPVLITLLTVSLERGI